MTTELFPEAMPHGELRELFPDIFFLTGTMRAELLGSNWQFSRNMIVVREGRDLTLINSIRLDDQGLEALDALGRVKHLVRIGDLHGLDDAFYAARYSPKYWGLPGMMQKGGIAPDCFLTSDRKPIDCSMFTFTTTKRPECVLRLDREGGVMIACDALQNWEVSDKYFDEQSEKLMKEMGFFTRANCGVLWVMVNEPGAEDFQRLREISYEHALCGHGEPLQGGADAFYSASFSRLFGI